MDKTPEKDTPSVERLIATIGGVCEIGKILRDGLLENGFTREEAVMIVAQVIGASIK